MRPTDFCHLNDLRAPVPRAFPAHSATFIAWKPPSFEGAPYEALGVWAPCGLTGGPSVSRHSRTLRRTLTDTRCLASISARALMSVSQVSSVGVFFPRCLSLVEPLTPLSPLPLPRDRPTRLRVSFSGLGLSSRALSLRLSLGRKPPRSP